MDATAITAIGAMLVAVIGAIFAGLQSLKTGRKVDDVHKVVNGQASIATARNEQLTATINDAGLPIPPSPPPPNVEPPAQ